MSTQIIQKSLLQRFVRRVTIPGVVMFLLFSEVALLLHQWINPAPVSLDPRIYPLQLQTEGVYRAAVGLQNIRYGDSTLTLRTKYLGSQLDMAVQNLQSVTRYTQVGDGLVPLPRSVMDFDGDSQDELLILQPWPRLSMPDHLQDYAFHQMDSLEIRLLDFQDNKQHHLITIQPDKPDLLWGTRIQLPWQISRNRIFTIDSTFFLSRTDTKQNYLYRELMFMESHPPFRLGHRIQVPFTPDVMDEYRDSGQRQHLLVSGSGYYNHAEVGFVWQTPSGETDSLRLTDQTAGCLQLSPDGEVEWAFAGDRGAGATWVLAPDVPGDDVIVIFRSRNFNPYQSSVTYVYRLDPTTGRMRDRDLYMADGFQIEEVSGRTGKNLLFLQYPDMTCGLLPAEGEPLRIDDLQLPIVRQVQRIQVKNNQYIWVVFLIDQKIRFYSDSWQLLGIASGSYFSMPLAAGAGQADLITLEQEGGEKLICSLRSVSALEYLPLRYRRVLLWMTLPQLLIITGYFIIRYLAARALMVMESRQRVESVKEQIEEKTAEIALVNKDYRQELEQRRQAEQKLLDQREELETLFNTVHDGIILAGNDGYLRRVNRAAHELFGVENGTRVTELPDKLSEYLSAVVQENQQFDEIVSLHSQDGRAMHLHLRGRRLPGEIARGILVVRDLTSIYANPGDPEMRVTYDRLIGRHPSMQSVYQLIDQISDSIPTVLITGESGTGKELVARALHRNSPRASALFVAVNCAALPETLLESELFGYKKGAFTGADRDLQGRFEVASSGTIFLDEIGELAPETQAKLLRVLQDGEFHRLGDPVPRISRARVIAATNRDIQQQIRLGRFREDLYYRLNVIHIALPSLARRRTDIPYLMEHFITYHRKKTGRQVERVSSEAMEMLMHYHWPGNVRELENAVEYAFVISDSDQLEIQHFPPRIRNFGQDPLPETENDHQTPGERNHEAGEREQLLTQLQDAGWVVSRVARELNVSRNTLYQRMKKWGIKRPGNSHS